MKTQEKETITRLKNLLLNRENYKTSQFISQQHEIASFISSNMRELSKEFVYEILLIQDIELIRLSDVIQRAALAKILQSNNVE